VKNSFTYVSVRGSRRQCASLTKATKIADVKTAAQTDLAMNKTITPRHCLKLMSWNINHHRDKFEGVKFEIAEVQRRIANHDIVCLQETKGKVSIREFKCFNANRSGSNSGGVCTAIRKSLAAGVNRVNVPNCDDILIIKLKAKYFNLDKDLNLINVYDSPSNGSYKKRMRLNPHEFTTTCEHLEDCLREYLTPKMRPY
jgi:exonuclease III